MAPNFSMNVSMKNFNKDAVRVELLAAARKAGDKLKKEFEKTTASWEGEKPGFVPDYGVEMSDGAFLNMTMAGGLGRDKWVWLNFGTRPHAIEPKSPGGVLAFQSGYQSKTTPGVIGSSSGGASGPMVFSRGVMHPGTKARNWSPIIMKNFKPVFRVDMKDALATGLRKAKG